MFTRIVLVIGLAILMIACGSAENDAAEKQSTADEIAGESPAEATVFDPLVEAMENARTPEKAETIATAKMVELCQKLIDLKVPAIHFYTMGTAKATRELLKGLLG